MEYITYEEFKKMDIKFGTIKEIVPVEGTDKLLRCQIDFGLKPISAEIGSSEHLDGQDILGEREHDIRQIISGIREFYPDYEKLIGKQVLYIVNLEPRKIKGFESQGMLMAVDGKDGRPVFIVPDTEVDPGAQVR